MSIMDDGKTYVELTIAYDETCENPLDPRWRDGQWTHIDFRRGYGDDPRKYEDFIDEQGHPNIGLRRKLKVGTAFLLDRYTHSGDHWCFHSRGDLPFDPGGWDTSHYAGLLLWEHKPSDMGAKTYADRKKDASGSLDEFNRWLSGDCYWFSIEGLDDFAFEESCGGFIGSEYACESIREELPKERPLVIVYAKGDTDNIVWADHKWCEGVETMTMAEYREMVEEREEELDAEGDELAESERLEMVA